MNDYREDGSTAYSRVVAAKNPPKVITRETEGDWYQDSSWGQVLRTRFPGTGPAGNRTKIDIITKTTFPGPPRPRGILLTRGLQSITDTAGGADVKALVSWGCGGFKFTSRFDWSNGAFLLIPAQTITIQAEIVPTFENWPDVSPVTSGPNDFVLGAMFCDKPATGHTAQFTQSYYQLGGLITSWEIPVPEFAKSARIWLANGLVAGDASVRFYGPALGFDLISSFDAPDIERAANQPIGVPGNAAWMRIDTTGNISPNVIWNLAL